MAEAQTVEQHTQERAIYSCPVFNKTIKINSLQAQRVVTRKFERVKHALFSIDVILPFISTQEKIDEIGKLLEDIKKVEQDIDKSEAQFKKLIEDHGIEDKPTYTHPSEYDIEITSPQVAQFASLIKKLDVLIEQMDTLWFHGVLTNKQRKDGTYQWQQRLLKLADRITGIAKRARAAAHAQGKLVEASLDSNEEEVNQETVDEELLQKDEIEKAAEK